MADLSKVSDEELMAEAGRRGALGVCPTCKRWRAYVGVYDSDGRTLRCGGCVRAVGKCLCG